MIENLSSEKPPITQFKTPVGEIRFFPPCVRDIRGLMAGAEARGSEA